MTHTDTYAGVANGLQYILTALQSDQIFQIIQLCLSILTTIILATLKIISWVKNAKKDGKIDEQEINQAIVIVQEAADELKKDADELGEAIGKDENENG